MTKNKTHELNYVTSCLAKFAEQYSLNPAIGTIDLNNKERVVWTVDVEKVPADSLNALKEVWEDYQYSVNAAQVSRYWIDGVIETEIGDPNESLMLELRFHRMYRTVWSHGSELYDKMLASSVNVAK